MLLDGRVIVAHNAAFDVRFPLAELGHAGYLITVPGISLCTWPATFPRHRALARRRLRRLELSTHEAEAL